MIDKNKIFKDLESQRKKFGLSFVDIDRIFEDNGFHYKGIGMLSSESYPKLIYWLGWNETAIRLFKEYLAKYNLITVPVASIFYYMAGEFPNMPVIDIYRKRYTVKQLKGYKRDHWIPCEIRSRN